jgi:NADH dehydrogenase
MILVVGATGMLGSEICRLLAESKKPLRALVRTTSNPETVARLRGLGAEVVIGDLKDGSSVAAACRGASAVISTASATTSRSDGDSLDTVDRQGQLDLIAAAAAAGVGRFVLVSFASTGLDFPLQSAKRSAEESLRRSGMTFSILHPTCFAEVWLGPHLGFDPANGKARIYGAGENKTSWISFRDVARFAVAALDNPAAKNAVVKLGGPEALSPLEVVRLAEKVTGRKVDVEHVPVEALRAQFAGATDPMQKTFAGLMLYYAAGDTVDMKETCRKFSIESLRTIRDHLQSLTSAAT